MQDCMTKLCPYARLGILLLINTNKERFTQQCSTPGEPPQPLPLPGSMPGRCGTTAGSETHICRVPLALSNRSPSLEHLNIQPGPCQLLWPQWWQGRWPMPRDPGAHLVRVVGRGAEHPMGTLDRHSLLVADEHTRDPQPTTNHPTQNFSHCSCREKRTASVTQVPTKPTCPIFKPPF